MARRELFRTKKAFEMERIARVSLEVSRKRTLGDEVLLTDITAKVLLSDMGCLLMVGQGASMGELPLTDKTFMCELIGVNARVSSETILPREGAVAMRALKWLVSRVRAKVNGEFVLPTKRESADWAHQRDLVRPLLLGLGQCSFHPRSGRREAAWDQRAVHMRKIKMGQASSCVPLLLNQSLKDLSLILVSLRVPNTHSRL